LATRLRAPSWRTCPASTGTATSTTCWNRRGPVRRSTSFSRSITWTPKPSTRSTEIASLSSAWTPSSITARACRSPCKGIGRRKGSGTAPRSPISSPSTTWNAFPSSMAARSTMRRAPNTKLSSPRCGRSKRTTAIPALPTSGGTRRKRSAWRWGW